MRKASIPRRFVLEDREAELDKLNAEVKKLSELARSATKDDAIKLRRLRTTVKEFGATIATIKDLKNKLGPQRFDLAVDIQARLEKLCEDGNQFYKGMVPVDDSMEASLSARDTSLIDIADVLLRSGATSWEQYIAATPDYPPERRCVESLAQIAERDALEKQRNAQKNAAANAERRVRELEVYMKNEPVAVGSKAEYIIKQFEMYAKSRYAKAETDAKKYAASQAVRQEVLTKAVLPYWREELGKIGLKEPPFWTELFTKGTYTANVPGAATIDLNVLIPGWDKPVFEDEQSGAVPDAASRQRVASLESEVARLKTLLASGATSSATSSTQERKELEEMRGMLVRAIEHGARLEDDVRFERQTLRELDDVLAKIQVSLVV